MRIARSTRRTARWVSILALCATGLAATGCDSNSEEGATSVDGIDDASGQTTGGTDPLDATTGDATATTGSDATATTGSDTSATDVTDEDTASGDTGEQPGEPLVTVELSVTTDAAAGGASAPFSLEVPPNTTSMTISVIGSTGMIALVNALTSPSGEVLILPNWFQSPFNQGGTQLCLNCALRVAPQESASGTLVPNTPEIAFEPGTWTMSVAAITVEQLDGPFGAPTVTLKTADLEVVVAFQSRTELDTSVLDLNLFFTGADGLTAEGAPTDVRMIDALSKMRAIYATQDIELGAIRYLDLSDAGLDKITSMTGADNDFEALARETADAPPGVNVVFVESITDASSPLAGFGVILGVAGGIPGPTGIQGTGRSVVAVTLETNPGDPSVTFGNTMAHEVGHYLGLYHSSEFSFPGQPGIHDPIADTPEDDDTNMMHNTGAGGVLTPGQAFVMKNNPWVRPVGQE